MKNFIQEGEYIDVVAPSGGLVAGRFYKVGAIAGIVASTVLVGITTALRTRGIFTMGKATGAAWVAGDALFWDSGNNVATKVAAGNTPMGFAAGAAASGDATGLVAVGHGTGLRTVGGQITTATAADTVVTGLSLVLSVVASYETDPADANFEVSAQIGDQAGTPAAGSVVIKTWQNTSGSDPTPIAAGAFSKKVNWIAVGV